VYEACICADYNIKLVFNIDNSTSLTFLPLLVPQYRSATYVSTPQQYPVPTGTPGFYPGTNTAEYGTYGKRLYLGPHSPEPLAHSERERETRTEEPHTL